MEFSYQAKNKGSARASGVVEAVDRKSAIGFLKSQGLFVLKIGPASKHSFESLNPLHNRIPLRDKIIFTKQLSIMVRSGLSLIDALHSLKGEALNRALGEVIDDIAKEVGGGTYFSEALKKHERVFGDIYINMVKSGEESGNLDKVLERLALHMEKDYELIRKVKGALTYPVFIFATMAVVITIVIVYVIPQLKVVFDDAGVSLPPLTRGMIGLSMFLQKYIIFIVIALAASAFLAERWRRSTRGKRFFDNLFLHIPVVSLLLKKSFMARFTRTFAALVNAGLPLLEVFKASGKVIGNVFYEEEVNAMAKKVESGTSLSVVFKKSKLFPGMVGQLAAVGEKSGNIDEVFDSMADFFEKEVDNITSNLSALLEPMLMVIIGICIGLVIISVLQPIYGLVGAM